MSSIAQNLLILLTGLAISFDKLAFSCELYTQDNRQKKFHLDKEYSGSISDGVRDFFTVLRKEYLKDDDNEFVRRPDGQKIWTGKQITGFEMWCQANGIVREDGQSFDAFLSNIQFKCENNSDNYWLNPFRLYVDEHTGSVRLNMVWEPAMGHITKKDPVTGKVTTKFFQKYVTDRNGNRRKARLGKNEFLRYKVRELPFGATV